MEPRCLLATLAAFDAGTGAVTITLDAQNDDATVETVNGFVTVNGSDQFEDGAGGSTTVSLADVTSITATGSDTTSQLLSFQGDFSSSAGGNIDSITAQGTEFAVFVGDFESQSVIVNDVSQTFFESANISGDVTVNSLRDTSIRRSDIGGNLVSESIGGFNFSESNIAGDVSIESNVANIGANSIGGDFSIASDGNIGLNDVTISGNANFEFDEAFILRTSVGGDLNSESVARTSLRDVTVTGDASVASEEFAELIGGSFGGDLRTNAAAGTFAVSLNVDGATEVSSGGDAVITGAFDGPVRASSSNNITIESTQDGSVSVTSGGSTTLSYEGDVLINAANVGTDLTVASSEDLSYLGSVVVGGDANLSAANAIDLGRATRGSSTVGGDATIEGGSVQFGRLTVDGGLEISADAGIIGGGSSSVGDTLTLNAGTDIVLDGEQTMIGSVDVTSGGSTTLSYGTGDIVIDGADVGGDLTVDSAANITSSTTAANDEISVGGLVNLTGAGVHLEFAGDIELNDVDADSLVLTGTASAPDSGLDSAIENLNESASQIAALVPNRFDFSEGATGFQIIDGGNDMFDGGNILNTNLASQIEYTDGVATTSDDLFGTGSEYFTAKHDGLFVLTAENISIDSFSLSGDNGADGNGTADGTVLSTNVAGGHTIYVKRVSGTSDPSINDIIIVPGDGTGISHTFATNTNDGANEITGLANIDKLYFLLVASENGGVVSDAEILAIAEEFLVSVPAEGGGGGPSSISNAANASISVDGSAFLTADSIDLGNQAGDNVEITRVGITATEDASLNQDSDVRLLDTTATNLQVSVPGGGSSSISNAADASISVDGSAFLTADSIDLGNQAGDNVEITRVGITATEDASLNQDSDVRLLDTTATNLQVTSTTQIRNGANANIAISGDTALSAPSTIVGNQTDDSFDTGRLNVNAEFASIEESGDTELYGDNSVTNLVLNSTGALTDADSATLNVSNLARLQGNSITIGDSATYEARITEFNSPGDVSIEQDSRLALFGDNTAGSLELTSSDRIIDTTNATTNVTANANLAAPIAILGDNATDEFNTGSLSFDSSAFVSISEDSSTLISGDNLARGLVIESAGAIENADGTVLTTTGRATLAGTQINIGDAVDDAVSLRSLNFNSTGSVTVEQTGRMFLIGDNTADSLNLSATGSLIDQASASLSVNGNARFAGTFIGIGDTATDSVSAQRYTFESTGTVIANVEGDLILVGDTTANVLNLTSPGDIIDSDNSTTTVNSLLSLDAGFAHLGGNLDADSNQQLNFGRLTVNTTGSANIVSGSSFALAGTSNVGDRLVLRTDGNITDAVTSSLTVENFASFTATDIIIGELADDCFEVLAGSDRILVEAGGVENVNAGC